MRTGFKLVVALAALVVSPLAAAVDCHGDPTSETLAWYERFCSRLTDTWKRGGHSLLLSGYSWHTPWTYTKEKRDELESDSWGGGYGRVVYDEKGDEHMVYGLAFQDSHRNAQIQVGYAWTRYWGTEGGLQGGLGYTLMIVQRPDIWNGIPFPAALPLASVRYDRAVVTMTFIPTVNGGVNNGSVLYVMGRYNFK
ncbi:MAG: lipid IV(A) palmitoyltransferase PagP [Burkholderiales bacterium]|nr:lipid IV(A) palmitoyltransferase PagP [Burkholderiales bacterium]MCE7876315.1 lipid IV(A) palmitoyltransferase PagP [Betaproteobacteria bacterium PRO3]